MLFEQAWALARQGKAIAYAGWKSRGPKWVEIDEGSHWVMSHPVLCYGLDYPGAFAGHRVPWYPGRCELLLPGWRLFERPKLQPRAALPSAQVLRRACEQANGAEP